MFSESTLTQMTHLLATFAHCFGFAVDILTVLVHCFHLKMPLQARRNRVSSRSWLKTTES